MIFIIILMLCGNLPQRISRPATSFWLIGRLKQALANQCGPLQRQFPLDWAPLAAADKGVDDIMLVSRSYSYFVTASGVHMAIAALVAATPPTDSEAVTLTLWKAHRQCLSLYDWLTVTRLLSTVDSRR